MAPKSADPPENSSAPNPPTSKFAPYLNLLIFVQLFIVGAALLNLYSPSPAIDKMGSIFRPYTELFCFDLCGVPWYLTRGEVRDVDYYIEVLPPDANGDDPASWQIFSSDGFAASPMDARRRNYASTTAEVSDDQPSIAAQLIKQVALRWKTEHGAAPDQIRLRRRYPGDPDRELVVGKRFDNDEVQLETVYAAIILPTATGDLQVMALESDSKVARPITDETK